MSSRKRKRRKKRSLAARIKRRLQEQSLPDSKPAKASKYLHWLKQYHYDHPDMRVIIYIRDSSRSQDHKGNLDTHEMVSRRRLKRLKIQVVGCNREVSSGWILEPDKRTGLMNAVKEAKRQKAVIVTTSVDRVLRSIDFNTQTNPFAMPTEAEYEKVKKLTCNIPILTLLHPNMPPRKVRGYQTKWGQKAKNNKGGRPSVNKPGYKKQRRKEKLPKVLRLYEKNASLGRISALVGIPKSTVADWINLHKK